MYFNPSDGLRFTTRKQAKQLPPEVSIEYFLKPLKLQTLYDQYLREKANKSTTRQSYSF
jgi:hypothetical protein